MNRTVFLPIFLIAFTLFVLVRKVVAQREPVTWSISIDSLAKDTGTLIFNAKILPGWHLYSQHIPDGGPMPTTFTFHEQNCNAIGKTSEKGKRVVFHDEIYDMEVAWYEDNVIFSQRLQLLKPEGFVRGIIEYMVCNGEVCMPAKKIFSLPSGAR